MPTDTFEQVRAELIDFMKANVPAGGSGDVDETRTGSRTGWYFELRRPSSKQDPGDRHGDLQATVYVNMDDGYDREEDAEGNFWRVGKVEAEVSWPSWDGTEPGLAAERLALMQEACRFAQAIVERFPEPYRRLYMSAEERRANEETKRLRDIHVQIRAAIDKSVKGMRVGNERCVPSGDIPAGTYDLGLGDKEYRANVSEWGEKFLWFTRTK